MKNICEWENCKEFGDFKAPSEKDNSKIINKGIVCSSDIEKDTILTEEHLMYARPATFFHAKYIDPGWTKLEKVVTVGDHIFYK